MTFRDNLIGFLHDCQDVTLSDGLSFGYTRPPDGQRGWFAAYPETTGYCIPTLIREGHAERALRAGHWLLRVQQEGGWIPAYNRGIPAAFDTGMVLRGWLALRAMGSKKFDSGIERAGRWLSSNGAFPSFTDYYGGEVPGYFSLVSRPLHDAGFEKGAERYLSTADNQLPPLTHFHAYVAEALLEWGDPSKAIEMLSLQRDDGSIPAEAGVDWTCVPAVAQIAMCWYRSGHVEQAEKALGYVERIGHPLPGSWPRHEKYLPHTIPNWAAKYALDALHEQTEYRRRLAAPPAIGGVPVGQVLDQRDGAVDPATPR